MKSERIVYILGAGFSKASGMPLATELLPLICENLWKGDIDNDMQGWLDHLGQRLAWLSGYDQQENKFHLNIEEVFHYAHFDIEVHQLKQQLELVGRGDGPGTSWNAAESIESWLSYLERDLCDVIFKKDNGANLDPISRWAETLHADDAVITFNYDTLVERALKEVGKSWNHAMPQECDDGIAVCKLHGSIDWIVAHRSENLSKCDLLFDKENKNRREQNTGHIEEDYRLWRCRSQEQLQNWISGRDLQLVPTNASPKTVGIAGLGAYKPLHEIPGLIYPWTRGMKKLYESDRGIIVGFSMSEFDAMAQMQFAEVASKRCEEGRPLPIIIIDPSADKEKTKERFRKIFRTVEFIPCCHQDIDWGNLTTKIS